MSGRVLTTNIRELIPDAKNANKGTKRGRDLHEKSLRNVGLGRSIAIDKHNQIIAGNKTAEVAAEVYGTDLPVRVIETYGDELIAVKRMDLDLNDDHGKAREMAIADNRVSQENLAFSAAAIEQLKEAGVKAVSEYWFESELSGLFQKEVGADTSERVKSDPPKTYHFAEGDTILFGTHRLIVGEALDEVDELIGCWESYTGEDAHVRRRE